MSDWTDMSIVRGPSVSLNQRLRRLFKRCIWVVPKTGDTPKSSILMGFSLINHPFGGYP